MSDIEIMLDKYPIDEYEKFKVNYSETFVAPLSGRFRIKFYSKEQIGMFYELFVDLKQNDHLIIDEDVIDDNGKYYPPSFIIKRNGQGGIVNI